MKISMKGVFAFIGLLAFIAYADALEGDPLNVLKCGIVEPVPTSFTLSTSNNNQTILMIGSSSTSGVGAGGKSNAYPARTAYHLNKMAGLPHIEVIARGIGGERAKGAITRLTEAIEATNPDLLVWQVGTNDALGKVPLSELEKTIEKGLEIATSHQLPIILIDPQFFPRILNNETYRQTVDLIAETAAQNALPVVKRYNRMKRALTIDNETMEALLAKDRFHMSRIGHECLAKDLTATLKQGFMKKAANTANNQQKQK